MENQEPIEEGWDSRVFIVDGEWVDREPRRPEVAAWLVTETRVLPWLADRVPLSVPRPEVVQQVPLRVRHRMIRGGPTQRLDDGQGRALGEFFRALHDVDADAAVERGVPDPDRTRAEHLVLLGRLRSVVLPRLDDHQARLGEALLDRLALTVEEPTLVHADVGPQHLLSEDGEITGVVDWGDLHVGDPAMDLAWLTNGSGAEDAVAEGYGADEQTLARAWDWHLLSPWHEVVYGLGTDRPELVESGMDGVRSRLVPRP
jgi:aminoglycoside phosphotransferase (APT) family kinase protein